MPSRSPSSVAVPAAQGRSDKLIEIMAATLFAKGAKKGWGTLIVDVRLCSKGWATR